MSTLIARKKEPPTTNSSIAAYHTHKPLEQLQAEHLQATTKRDVELKAIREFMTLHLTPPRPAPGQPPADAPPPLPPLALAVECLGERLDVQQYPYRPEVSLLLQYYRRPHIIATFAERVIEYNKDIPCEL